MIEAEMRRIAEATAVAHGAVAEMEYSREFVPTVNAAGPTAHALQAARRVFASVDDACSPIMPSEDFAQLLAEVPGNFAFVGNGEASAPLHNPTYDFNDAVLPSMIAYYAALVRARLVPTE